MEKTNYTKTLAQLYQPSATAFSVVDVPPMAFLMIDGHGDPNHTPAHTQAVEALYAVAYRVKFMCKAQTGHDYVVPPLEGLWWADDMAAFTSGLDKSAWDWTMMIMLPEQAAGAIAQQAIAEVARAKQLPALAKIRQQIYHEGCSAQIMHIGPYSEEGPTLARLHDQWMPQNGYTFGGKHHEIYLSDVRRTAPAKLKTVLRQPIRRAGVAMDASA
ncbi:hypothetical protein F8S13_21310 [Chloroflexia bacterium SDU3-3]|nr:hypothetical protein F8S13_21310 [Chloroflexia bacterium SDU3-3]